MGTPTWSPPSDDELEVSVFGRGLGEAVLVHLGGRRWLAVDSTAGADGLPISLSYLTAIGVDPGSAVRMVVASHWDSDHVRGINALFEASASAEFVFCSAQQDPEVIDRIYKRGNPRAVGAGRTSVDEMAAVWSELDRRGELPAWAGRGSLLWDDEDGARVWSLTPSRQMQTRSLVKLIDNTRRGADPGLDRRNHLSIVLWIEVGAHRILLGGDLEEKPHGGWSAAITSRGRSGQRAAVIKIPHHGSANAHHDGMWDEMLEPDPWTAVTPFAASGLPREEDRRRIRSRTANAFQAGDQRPVETERDAETARLIQAFTASGTLTALTGKLGHVRFRTRLAETGRWEQACFGSAGTL